MKLLKLLSEGGIEITDDHKQILYPEATSENNIERSAEAKNQSQNEASLSKNEAHCITIGKIYIDKRTTSGQTPLHLSADAGNAKFVDIFIKAGAKTDATDCNGRTPLHLSSMRGHKKSAKILIKASINVDLKDKNGKTSLHLSAENGWQEIVKVLLKANATVNVKDLYRRTPLHLSSSKGHIDAVKILLKFLACVDATDNYAQTALHLSAVNGHSRVVEALLNAKADVKAQDNYDQTSLHLSASRGHIQVVNILLKAGSEIIAVNKNGQTPLDLCHQFNHTEVAEVLLNAEASIKDKVISGNNVQDCKDVNNSANLKKEIDGLQSPSTSTASPDTPNGCLKKESNSRNRPIKGIVIKLPEKTSRTTKPFTMTETVGATTIPMTFNFVTESVVNYYVLPSCEKVDLSGATNIGINSNMKFFNAAATGNDDSGDDGKEDVEDRHEVTETYTSSSEDVKE